MWDGKDRAKCLHSAQVGWVCTQPAWQLESAPKAPGLWLAGTRVGADCDTPSTHRPLQPRLAPNTQPTSASMRLNSSKQPHAPHCTRPLKMEPMAL